MKSKGARIGIETKIKDAPILDVLGN